MSKDNDEIKLDDFLKEVAKNEKEKEIIELILDKANKTDDSVFIKEVFIKMFQFKTLSGFNPKKIDIFINAAVNNKKNAMKKQELVDFSNKHGIDLKMKLIDLLSRNFNYVLYNE